MGPYNITQVDVPGLLAVAQGAQDRRLNQMLLQRKVQMEDRAQELNIKKQSVLASVFKTQGQPSSPASGPPADLMAPYTSPPTSALAGAPVDAPAPMAPAAPQSLVDPSSLPPRTDGMSLNPEAMKALYQIDPDMAEKLQSSVFNANKEQLGEIQRQGGVMASAAFDLKKVPVDQRAGEVAKLVPWLRSQGVPESALSPQALANMPLDDRSLDRMIITGRSLSDVIRDERADNAPQWIRTEDPNGQVTLTPMPRNGAAAPSGPPAEAINYLRSNPALAPQFDAKYGPGASRSYLSAAQPMSADDAGPMLQDAQNTGTISSANAARIHSAFGPNGGAAFETWMKAHNIRIAD